MLSRVFSAAAAAVEGDLQTQEPAVRVEIGGGASVLRWPPLTLPQVRINSISRSPKGLSD